jgi:ATP-dependent RNA helicase DDX10/DBP4
VIGKFHDSLSAGLLIGGPKNYKEEVRAIRAMNILVATPGRLLQHLSESGVDTGNFEILGM